MSKKLTIKQKLQKDLKEIESKYDFPLGHDLNREKQAYRSRYLRPVGAPGEGGKDTRKDSPHEGVIYKQRGDENWNIIMATVEADSRKAYEIRQKINAIDGNIIHGIRRAFSRKDAQGRNRFQLQHENYLKNKFSNKNTPKEKTNTDVYNTNFKEPSNLNIPQEPGSKANINTNLNNNTVVPDNKNTPVPTKYDTPTPVPYNPDLPFNTSLKIPTANYAAYVEPQQVTKNKKLKIGTA